MCERLWSGLHSEAFKSSTRNKLDSSQQYDQLLKDIRQVERELKLSSPPKSRAHSNIQIQPLDMQRHLKDLKLKFNPLVSGIQSNVDQRLTDIMKRLDSLSLQPSFSQPSQVHHSLYPPCPTAQQNNQQPHNVCGRGNGYRGRGGIR
ncbi:hypothetical protein DPMN_043839 [Dreissena polymorpha]|uniref:Uncharacterized protein n=1 Tax=Dreissena polymorpha TaxID=45954 RepID=A0A9D4D3I5_DREPO|nr:hypothetical protein DPMN_043839 [Dreissena polymorpha]